MLFHRFQSQEERRSFGGSGFIELQFCKLPPGTTVKRLVAVDSITYWQNDSLYVADENQFYEMYSPVFTGGVYNNLQSGPVDIYGINYYPPSTIAPIVEQLRRDYRQEHEPLLQWLNQAKGYNGFYILGI